MAKRPKSEIEKPWEVDELALLHPRHTQKLYGQDELEAVFLRSYNLETLSHGWLLTGRKGVGKATFAYRAARFLLSRTDESPAGTLDISATHPVFRQVVNRAHPSLCVLEGDATKTSATISVDDVRKLRSALSLSSTSYWRVVIVDAANELTQSSANALLKVLEEPPPRTVFFLVVQGALAVMPTIKSRCVRAKLSSLSLDELEQAIGSLIESGQLPKQDIQLLKSAYEKAAGAPGRAVALLTGDTLKLSEQVQKLFETLPKLDRSALHHLVRETTGARNARLFWAVCDLIEEEVEAKARANPQYPGWANLWETLRNRRQSLEMLNLDKGAFLIGAFSDIEQTAQIIASANRPNRA